MNKRKSDHSNDNRSYKISKFEENSESNSNKSKFVENPPSRVIHLRGLPLDISEHEIASVAVPFGNIHYLVVTRKTGQSLIEMETTEVAETMFDFYQKHPPYIRNKRCFMQFSIHNSLQAPNSHMHPDAENAVIQANQAFDSMSKENGGRVLRFIVEDWNRERINAVHLYKIFYHYGMLDKIVVYVNKGTMQGFIQFKEDESAKVAKALTNGLNIFPGCCTLRVYFSNRETLDIGKEDDMVRDFVTHPVSAEELKGVQVNIGGDIKREIETPIYRERCSDPMEALAALQPMLSRAARNPEDALPMLRSLAPAIQGFLDSTPRESIQEGRFNDKVSPLLIVSNLNETKVTPDALFKLFGHYGDVVRVKIMYNRKNTALVQFAIEEHADRANHFLNGITLFGKEIHCNFSKHDKINNRAPIPGSDEDKTSETLHKDYSESKLHRFRKRSSRNHINVYEPGRVLHIAGLVEEATDEDVEELFQEHKFDVIKIRMFEVSKSNMALVELNSVDAAVEALIVLHDYDLGGSHLRVSFSKGNLN